MAVPYESRHGFSRNQKVEAQFKNSGYRGGWFRGKILDIRQAEDGNEQVLLSYLDFVDEEDVWVRVCVGNPPTWMVRPVPPIFREGDNARVQEYALDNVPEGGELRGYMYNDNFREGEAVEVLWEDVFWPGTITRINNRLNTVMVAFPGKPFGQGFSEEHGKEKLRPAMSWDPDSKKWIHQFEDFPTAQAGRPEGGSAQGRPAQARPAQGGPAQGGPAHVWAIP